MLIRFLILGVFWSLLGCSTSLSDTFALKTTAQRVSHMQLKAIGESVLLNEQRVTSTASEFEQGLVESRDEKSIAEIIYPNGEKITLKNGKAHFGYMSTDSISGLPDDKALPEINLNQRKIVLYSGNLFLEVKQGAELNKTSYSISLGKATINTKSGSIKLDFEQTGKLQVLQGTADIIYSGNENEKLVRRNVQKGQEIEILNPNSDPTLSETGKNK